MTSPARPGDSRDSRVEKLADKYREFGSDGPSLTIRAVRERAATEDIAVFESAGLMVLDRDKALERIADVFWMQLQDYLPGLDREDWDQLVHRNIQPDLLRALAGNGGSND